MVGIGLRLGLSPPECLANNDGADGQSYPDVYRTGWAAATVGAQRGALHSKHQVQPLVGYGLGKDEHFHACLGVAQHRRDPWSQAVTAPQDLKFAAEAKALVSHRSGLYSTSAELRLVNGSVR